MRFSDKKIRNFDFLDVGMFAVEMREGEIETGNKVFVFTVRF